MYKVLKFLNIYLIFSALSFAQEGNELKEEAEKKQIQEPKEAPKPLEKLPEEKNICLPISDYRSVGIWGHGGFFRTESAQILPQNPQGFYGSYNLKFMNQRGLISDGTSSMRLDHILGMTYVPLPFTEFSVVTSAYTNLEDNNAELIQQMGNLAFGSKAGYSFFKALYFATTGKLEIKSRVGDLNIRDRVINYNAKGELTFDLVERFKKPFRFHANMGYHIDGTPESLTSLNTNELYYTDTLFYDQLLYGGGIEWLFKNMILGTEYSGEYPLNTEFKFTHTPQRISGGIKIFPHDSSSLAINIGGEIGIFKRKDVMPVPDITFLAGLSFIFSPSKTLIKTHIIHHYPTKKDAATLRGIVKDKADDKAIEDSLIVIKGEKKGLLTDAKGRFEITDLPFDKKTIIISKIGYITKEFDIEISEEDKILAREFLLEALPTRKKAGPSTPSAPNNSEGKKIVLLELNPMEDITVKHTKNKIITSEQIYFELGKMNIHPSSLHVLDKIVEYIKKHPELKTIRAEGFTDTTGSVERNVLVSKERAKKVREYLIAQGINKKMLTYDGYGSKNAISSNDTNEGRMKNRRVELRIIKAQK